MSIVNRLRARWYRVFAPSRDDCYGDLSKLLLRIWFGGAMVVAHGWGKIGRFMEDPSAFRDPIGLGPELSLALVIFAEVLCAVLIVIGLATRLATIPLIITMIVAGFVVNWFHLQATSYLVAYVVLLLIGPGRYSLDHYLWPRPKLD